MLLLRSETLLLATVMTTMGLASTSASAEASSSLLSGGRRLRGAKKRTAKSAATNNYACGSNSFHNGAPLFYCDYPCQNIGDGCPSGLECLDVGPTACPSPPTAVGESRATNNGGNGGEEVEGGGSADDGSDGYTPGGTGSAPTAVNEQAPPPPEAAAYMESGYFVQHVRFYDEIDDAAFFDAYESLVRDRVLNEFGASSGVIVDKFDISGMWIIPGATWVECEHAEAPPRPPTSSEQSSFALRQASSSSKERLSESASRINSHQTCTTYVNKGSSRCFGFYATFAARSEPDGDDASYAELFLERNRRNMGSWKDELTNYFSMPVDLLDVLDTEGQCGSSRRF